MCILTALANLLNSKEGTNGGPERLPERLQKALIVLDSYNCNRTESRFNHSRIQGDFSMTGPL